MTYTYSYSGADCRAYAWFENNPGAVKDLSSLATISISVHEAKAPVRRLGHVGVSGYSKGIRTIAGTMVFLVIEDHPLRTMMEIDPIGKTSNYYYSEDRDKGVDSEYGVKLSTMISPFNILLKYQTEVVYKERSLYNFENNPFNQLSAESIAERAKAFNSTPGGASMLLKNIEITGESIVTSVNDMVTEVVVQFVAEDIKTLKKEETDLILNQKEMNLNIKKIPKDAEKETAKTTTVSITQAAEVASEKVEDTQQIELANVSTDRLSRRNTNLKMPSTPYEKTYLIADLDSLLEQQKVVDIK